MDMTGRGRRRHSEDILCGRTDWGRGLLVFQWDALQTHSQYINVIVIIINKCWRTDKRDGFSILRYWFAQLYFPSPPFTSKGYTLSHTRQQSSTHADKKCESIWNGITMRIREVSLVGYYVVSNPLNGVRARVSLCTPNGIRRFLIGKTLLMEKKSTNTFRVGRVWRWILYNLFIGSLLPI